MVQIARIGRISSINYKTGMVRVAYPAEDNSVSDDLPYFNMFGEYRMPDIDDMVFTVHLQNDASSGICIGTFWNMENIPAEGGKNIFRKELSRKTGEAFMKYDDTSKELIINAGSVKIQTDQGITEL